jgi:putative membrane protein
VGSPGPPETASGPDPATLICRDPAVELSSNRTSLSIERTRMSADRTLMSVLRTSLALIGFGFTVNQAFRQLHKINPVAVSDEGARNFGLALVLLGILMLSMGIVSHALLDHKITERRGRLFAQGLLHREIRYHATPTFIVAVLLLLIGLAAAGGIVFRLSFFA